jgi:hypothetical protein
MPADRGGELVRRLKRGESHISRREVVAHALVRHAMASMAALEGDVSADCDHNLGLDTKDLRLATATPTLYILFDRSVDAP